MKKLFTLIFGVITLTTFADSLPAMNDTTSLTWGRVYQDAKDGIAGLAKALKVPAEYVYKVLVKQQVVYSFVYLTVVLFGVFFLWIGLKHIELCRTAFKTWKATSKDYGDFFSAYILTSVLFMIGAIICIVAGVTHVGVIITGFVNPNYGAIKEIVSFMH